MSKQVLMLVVGIMLMTAGCKSKTEKDVTAVYTATTPEITSTFISKDYVANIQSEKNIEIRAQKGGILEDIYVDEGQTVKAGQPLFRITTVGAQEELEKTKAETEQARIDLQNTSVDRVMWDKLTQEQRDEILRQEADKTSQSNATQSSTSETVEDNLFQETSKRIKEQAERKAREEKTETNETEAKPKKTFERRNYRSKNSPEENKKNNCAK